MQRTHTDVVVSALLALPIAIPVFRGEGPPDPLATVPYWVVHAGLAVTDGPSADPYADLDPEVQVTSVGSQSDQAEYLADVAFAALIGKALLPPVGRSWMRPGAPVGHELTRPVERDPDYGAGSPLFYVAAVYSLPSTPST